MAFLLRIFPLKCIPAVVPLQVLFQMNLYSPIRSPAKIQKEAVLISGNKSALPDGVAYLMIKENDAIQRIFPIRFEYHSSPFQYHDTKNHKTPEEFFKPASFVWLSVNHTLGLE